MKTNKELKDLVRDKYADIAIKSKSDEAESCCGTACCTPESDYSFVGESYDKLEGYLEAADLGLGCGLPTEYAGIKEGHTVVDLGSGAGNDAFIARKQVGESGWVTGIDMTTPMIDLARANSKKLGLKNVDFQYGHIENMPLKDDYADVVISNCVMNLVPDKEKAFADVHRILKTDGHFCISDIVVEGELPDSIRSVAEVYAGCVGGAVQQDTYLNYIKDCGFSDLNIVKSREIEIPQSALDQMLSKDQIDSFKNSGAKILSITLTGKKS